MADEKMQRAQKVYADKIEDGLFEYLINFSDAMADRFNDKFFALAKGYLGLDQFIAENK